MGDFEPAHTRSSPLELRAQFELVRWPANARVMRAACVAAIFLNPLGGLTDYAISGATSVTWVLVALRVVAAAIHIPIYRLCKYPQPSPTLPILIVLGFLATVLSGVLGPVLLRPTSVASQGGPLLLIIILWSLVFPEWRNRKVHACLAVSAVYVTIGLYWRPLIGYGGQHELITISIFLIAVSVLLPKTYHRFEHTEFLLFCAQQGYEKTVRRLETEVGLRRKRETALVQARERADAENAAKQEFLANASHELRTPLVGVMGIAELLLDEKLTHGQRERIVLLQRSGKLLKSLVDDLLDFSKLAAGKLSVESIPMSPEKLFMHVHSLLAPRAAAKGIELALAIDPRCEPWILSDPTRVEQVALNLVANAIRFTERGRVTIEVTTFVDGENQLRFQFRVCDTGIGIHPDKLARIFQPFEQAEQSTQRMYGGTGLGLSISQQLVDLLGGHITVESTVGEGSVFSVDFVVEATNQPNQSGEEPTVKISTLRILLGEDNPVNTLVLTGLLRSLGHTVEVAEDGEKLVKSAISSEFDMILTDIQMPILDGITATYQIRSSLPPGKRPPIIALTADVSRRAVRDAKFDSVVGKPISRQDLQAAIEQCLRAQVRRDLAS